jgi:hypothetical protein
VEERGEHVGVVYRQRQLDENVLVADIGFLDASTTSVTCL